MKQGKIKKVIIPAAGLGTRFFPLTKAQPKEMLPVVDKPVIQYVVEEAILAGIDDILIITSHNKRAIEDHFDRVFELENALRKNGNGSLFDQTNRIPDLAQIHYIRQKHPRGLGHAIRCAEKHCNDQSFAVLLGDTITIPDPGYDSCTSQMRALYEKYMIPIIAIEKVTREKIPDYGIIDGKMIEERVYDIRNFIEKPTLKTAPSDLGAIGRYILTPDVFDILRDCPPGYGGEIQLTDAINLLPSKIGLITRCRRYDIGDKVSWMKANLALTLQHPKFAHEIRDYFNLLNSGENLEP